MQDMPRPRPPYLNREKTRHGEMVWYVRRHGCRIRIRAKYGTPDFHAQYQAALSATPPRPEKGGPAAGTLAWLIARYRETGEWQGFSSATRRQAEGIFREVIESAGDQPITRITAASIMVGRERRVGKGTPFQARHFLDAMRHVFRWAVKAQMVKADPTAGIGYPRLPKGDGFKVWTEEQVAAYERRWPIGTRQRVWFDVLLFTGLRRGDAVKLGKQHVRDGIATIKTEKTGTEVTLPILPELARTIEAGPVGDLHFIVGRDGKPLNKNSFGNLFGEACRAAGVPGAAHGLRKLAATRAANALATVPELEAIFGWTGGGMASYYTRAADRRRLAIGSMNKLAKNGS
jgi:integrase